MRYIFIAALLICALGLSGCAGHKAQELFETAEFEELQGNHDHAEELYRRIMEKYPETGYAKKARERVNTSDDPVKFRNGAGN